MRGYYPLIHYGYLWVFNFWDNPSDNMRGYYRMDPLMGVIWIILDNGKFHPLLCKTPMCKFRILNHGFWMVFGCLTHLGHGIILMLDPRFFLDTEWKGPGSGSDRRS